MFIELTNSETGRFRLINTKSINSVIQGEDLEAAILNIKGRAREFFPTESYAEVVTMIRNATDVQKVECVNKDKGVFKVVDFDNDGKPIVNDPDEDNYTDPFGDEDTNELN